MELHQHNHFDYKEKIGSKALLIAFVINFIFTAVEWFGGWYTNSLAIISDAIHDLGDTLMLGAVLYFERLSAKRATKKYTYGYRRFSTISSLINSTVLAVGSLVRWL